MYFLSFLLKRVGPYSTYTVLESFSCNQDKKCATLRPNFASPSFLVCSPHIHDTPTMAKSDKKDKKNKVAEADVSIAAEDAEAEDVEMGGEDSNVRSIQHSCRFSNLTG